MTRIKRFKAKNKEAFPPPPPPAAQPPSEDTESSTVNWTKLALGEGANRGEGSVSPYRLEAEPSAPETGDSDSGVFEVNKSEPDNSSETAENSHAEEAVEALGGDSGDSTEIFAASESGNNAPNSGEALAEMEETQPASGLALAEEKPTVETSANATPVATDLTDPSSTEPTPAELERQEREAKKAEKRAQKAAAKEAAKARRAEREAEREAEYASIPDARRVKLTVSRVNPLSAMKIGFLVAVAFALIQFVAAAALWIVLDMLHVFSSMQGFLAALSATALVNLMDALQFSRFIALVALYGVFQILVFTVLSWLAAVIYNLIARMVGGLHLVLTDD